MRKTILMLTVLLLTVGNAEAQNRRGNLQRKKVDRTERMERRADEITNSMVKTYDLNDKQKAELLTLNKKWISTGARDMNVTRGQNPNRDGNRKELNDLYLATPTLHREARIASLSKGVDEYKAELKKIMTSSQFKAYEKRISEGIEKVSGK